MGFEGETLRVRVTAPPVEGRANAALVRLLAARLGVGQGAVRIVTGHGGRTKIVAVDGLTLEAVRARLASGDAPVDAAR